MQIIKTVILFILISFNCFAQETLDELYLPPSNSVFNIDNNKNIDNSFYHRHAIKFTTLTTVRSMFGAIYELKLSKGFSVNVGGGLKFAENYYQISMNDELGIYDNSNDIVVSLNSYFNNSTRVNNISYYYNAAIRFQYPDLWIGNQFVELHFRHVKEDRLYKAEYRERYQETQTETFTGITNQYTFSMLFGNNFIRGKSKVKFYNEYYYGFGINAFSFNRIAKYDPDLYLERYYPTNQNHTLYSIAFYLGYNLGIAWK